MISEAKFQQSIIRWLRGKGCVVWKCQQNAVTQKGFPDLLCLKDGFWFALEVKKSQRAKKQPGQDQWVKRLDEMSYARFVYPENWEAIKKELRQML